MLRTSYKIFYRGNLTAYLGTSWKILLVKGQEIKSFLWPRTPRITHRIYPNGCWTVVWCPPITGMYWYCLSNNTLVSFPRVRSQWFHDWRLQLLGKLFTRWPSWIWCLSYVKVLRPIAAEISPFLMNNTDAKISTLLSMLPGAGTKVFTRRLFRGFRQDKQISL